MTTEQTQSEKFKQAAREFECDEDASRWDEIVAMVVAQKSPPEKTQPDP